MSRFKRATKQQAKLRAAFIGPAGSGKTWTALEVASYLGARTAVIDTERGSASKYSSEFVFDVLELDSFSPANYVEAIQAAEADGYDTAVIDSLSHAWSGKDGALEQVDRRGGKFQAWRDVTPMHNALVDAMLGARIHILATMRTKTEYVVETNERGKPEPRKVGMAPVQRDGLDYEFDVTATLDHKNALSIDKTRCSALSGRVFKHQNKDLADILLAWITDGEAMPPKPPSVADELVRAATLAPNQDALDIIKASARKGWSGFNETERKQISRAIEDSGRVLSDVVQTEAAQ